jgi:hypothetical protein
MPYIGTNTPSADSSSEGGDHFPRLGGGQSIIDDATYADNVRNTFPGYAEKPLSEQLEPIAVVGMGNDLTLRGFSVHLLTLYQVVASRVM